MSTKPSGGQRIPPVVAVAGRRTTRKANGTDVRTPKRLRETQSGGTRNLTNGTNSTTSTNGTCGTNQGDTDDPSKRNGTRRTYRHYGHHGRRGDNVVPHIVKGRVGGRITGTAVEEKTAVACSV